MASHSLPTDVESTSARRYDYENDPHQLSTKLKTSSELYIRKRDRYRAIGLNAEARKARRIKHFYEEQNDNINRWLKPVDEHVQSAKELEGENQLKYKIAVQGSFAGNLVLAALQVYAASSSGSLSLVATMSDAIFDPMSNIALMLCHRAINKVDRRKFPSGKARIETAGNIVFCFLMTSVSFIIIVLSVVELVKTANAGISTKPFHIFSIIAVGIAFATKLVLFLYCWALRNTYSQVRIIWEDHRNDLLINGFGILTSFGGSKLRWWIDPAGAIILALTVSILWLRTAYTECQLLIGVAADTEMQQWITYIGKPIFLLPTFFFHPFKYYYLIVVLIPILTPSTSNLSSTSPSSKTLYFHTPIESNLTTSPKTQQ